MTEPYKMVCKPIEYIGNYGDYKVRDNYGIDHIIDMGVGCVVKHPEYEPTFEHDGKTYEYGPEDYKISHEDFLNKEWEIEYGISTNDHKIGYTAIVKLWNV